MTEDGTDAILIISYKRAENIPTITALKEAQSKLPVYIIVGDDDPELDEYKKRYDNLVIFKKEDYMQKVDSVDNFHITGTPLYARKFCYDFARKNNIKKFVMLDDDYQYFSIRYVHDDKLKQKKITNIDDIFNSFFEVDSPHVSLAFSQNGDYIGGTGSRPMTKGYLFKIMNCFFCDTEKEIPFRGTFNDDVNGALTLSNTGIIPLTIGGFSLQQRDTQQAEGGLTESYLEWGTYVKSFYSIIIAPAAVKIRFMSGGTKEHKGHPRLHHLIKSDNIYPRIINEIYKKK